MGENNLSKIRSEILDLSKEMDEHFNNEIRICEKLMAMKNVTKEESEFLIDKTFNHQHSQNSEKLFGIDLRKVHSELMKGNKGKFRKS